MNDMETYYNFLRNTRFSIYRFRFRKIHELLYKRKTRQKDGYNNLKQSFARNYEAIKKYKGLKTTVLAWRKINRKLESVFLPYPPLSFLRNPLIMEQMFVTAGGGRLKHQINFLENIFPSTKLKRILEEDYFGEPLILNEKYLTSHNNVHQLYHLSRYLEATNCNLNEIKTITEWGGGYGCLAKIFRRLISRPVTYILIDTPLLSCLQWLYLAVIFGGKNVNLLLGPKSKIIVNKFNIVPVGLVSKFNLKADLFISTWGLSESSKQCQDDVIRKNWFGANNLLLAYRKIGKSFLYNGRLERFAKEKGAYIEKVTYCPGSNYSFL